MWLPLEENPVPIQSEESSSFNKSIQSLLGTTKSNPQYSQCHMYVDGENHSIGKQSCVNGYEFHFEHGNEWNIIAEWGLVCNRQ